MPLRSGSRSSRPCPAYEVAGDSFDYALNTDVLHVAIIDSVGHDIESSVVSHLVKRKPAKQPPQRPRPTEAYLRANEALTRVFRELTFATAAFGHLDLSSAGSAGCRPGTRPRSSPPAAKWSTKRTPYRRCRSACRARTRGQPARPRPRRHAVALHRWRRWGGRRGTERFGLDRLTDLLSRNLLADLPPAETLRRRCRAPGLGQNACSSSHVMGDYA
jgi:hypothetical protein